MQNNLRCLASEDTVPADLIAERHTSPEYRPLIALRKACTSDRDMLFVLEGA